MKYLSVPDEGVYKKRVVRTKLDIYLRFLFMVCGVIIFLYLIQ